MRTNSIIKLVLAFLVMAVVMVNLHLSSEENHRIFLSLTDIEKRKILIIMFHRRIIIQMVVLFIWKFLEELGLQKEQFM